MICAKQNNSIGEPITVRGLFEKCQHNLTRKKKHNAGIINLFTHTDLDGAGCAVLAHLYSESIGSSITVEHCDYSNIDSKVCALIQNITFANDLSVLPNIERHILITDISVCESTAKLLDDLQKSYPNITVEMIDHHQVRDEVKAFKWTHVDNSLDQCGTSLLYQHLKPIVGNLWCHKSIIQFVEDVCLYDTWRFDKTKETNSENLNILLYLIGAEEFELMVSDWIVSHLDEAICVKEMDCYPFIEYDRSYRKKYCALRNHSMKSVEYKGYNVGVVFAEKYISSVGDYVLQKNPDIDFCAVVNLPVSVSLRTRRDNINVGIDIARPLGGGGHPQAAGYQLDDIPLELIKELIRFNE